VRLKNESGSDHKRDLYHRRMEDRHRILWKSPRKAMRAREKKIISMLKHGNSEFETTPVFLLSASNSSTVDRQTFLLFRCQQDVMSLRRFPTTKRICDVSLVDIEHWGLKTTVSGTSTDQQEAVVNIIRGHENQISTRNNS
jgi:hypothetical protein